jgi:valyl-tRNA synthetase
MQVCLDVVRAIRALKLRFANSVDDFVVSHTQDTARVLDPFALEMCRRLARVKVVHVESLFVEVAQSDRFLTEPLTRTDGVVRVNAQENKDALRKYAESEVDRFQKKINSLKISLDSETSRLQSPEFLSRAPSQVKEKTFERVRLIESELDTLRKAKQALNM